MGLGARKTASSSSNSAIGCRPQIVVPVFFRVGQQSGPTQLGDLIDGLLIQSRQPRLHIAGAVRDFVAVVDAPVGEVAGRHTTVWLSTISARTAGQMK